MSTVAEAVLRAPAKRLHVVGATAPRLLLLGAGGVGCALLQRLHSLRERLPLVAVANLERALPPDFIREDGLHVSEAFLRWARPLISGEAIPAFLDGLPRYWAHDLPLVPPRLAPYGGVN